VFLVVDERLIMADEIGETLAEALEDSFCASCSILR